VQSYRNFVFDKMFLNAKYVWPKSKDWDTACAARNPKQITLKQMLPTQHDQT